MEFLERKVLESWTDKVFGNKKKTKFGNKPGAADLETKFLKNTPTKKNGNKNKVPKNNSNKKNGNKKRAPKGPSIRSPTLDHPSTLVLY